MPCSDTVRARPLPGAVAIVQGDPPRVLLAENASVMSRLVALEVVADADPADLPSGQLEAIRRALLEERWADAVVGWIEATGTFVDIYEEYVPIWTERDLDEEAASMEIRVSRIFDRR